MTQDVHLQKVRIEVLEMGEHILMPLARFFNKNNNGRVVKLKIVGIYEDNIESKFEDLNLMEGDTVEVSVIKKGKKKLFAKK